LCKNNLDGFRALLLCYEDTNYFIADFTKFDCNEGELTCFIDYSSLLLKLLD